MLHWLHLLHWLLLLHLLHWLHLLCHGLIKHRMLLVLVLCHRLHYHLLLWHTKRLNLFSNFKLRIIYEKGTLLTLINFLNLHLLFLLFRRNFFLLFRLFLLLLLDYIISLLWETVEGIAPTALGNKEDWLQDCKDEQFLGIILIGEIVRPITIFYIYFGFWYK